MGVEGGAIFIWNRKELTIEVGGYLHSVEIKKNSSAG